MADAALLVVEDEAVMATVINEGLAARGYVVRVVSSGAGALAAIAESLPSVVVLDLGLPDVDGLDVCRRIRLQSDVPIIVLTADGSEDRKVAALEHGADDYVTKPFSMPELVARVGVAVRHNHSRIPDADAFRVGDVVIDVARHRVLVGGRPVVLTPREFDILAVLARYAGRVVTHSRILAQVWGPQGEGHVEYLRVHVRALRQKLAEVPSEPRVLTEPGVGYRLVDRTDQEPAALDDLGA
ncbi:MAG: response regulator transcription factor [Acidimicrobiales bacterium]